MATECTEYDGADEQPDVLGEFGCVGITWADKKRTRSLGEKDCNCKSGRLRRATTDRNDTVGISDQK